MTESESVNASDAAMANAVAVSGRLPQEQPPPPRGRFPHGVGEMSQSDKEGAGPAGPHDIFAAVRMKVS